LNCDVCIIGTGPAGATIARELSNTNLKVLLLESGGAERQADADALNEIESTGWPRILDQWLVRNRIIGGSSHTWSGRCAPFGAIDLAARDWVPHSGWPFGIEQLNPFLDRAAPYLGLSIGTGFTDDRFWAYARRKRPAPPINDRALDSFFWQFSRDSTNPADFMRFGKHLSGQLGSNVTLLADATVTRISLHRDGKAVEIAARDGQRRTVTAQVVILCAGGIENARLLLCSDIGNRHDQVGRYLMDHIRGPAGQFTVAGSEQFQQRFGHYRTRTGQVFSQGLQLSETVQREEGLLNASAWLEGVITEDDPFNAVKRLVKRQGNPRRDALSLLAESGLLARSLRGYFLDRQGFLRKISRLNLMCMAEQAPDPESRVTLAAARDRFGMPKARVDWRVNAAEQRTMRRMAELAAAAFNRMGYAPPVLDDWVNDGAPFPTAFQDVAHPTGTTRMGKDPAHSVVDADCRLHGEQGIYVAGSSVFPTSSHCNPTQMIVALALRLADTVRTLHCTAA
jgi:choline dehydrogenase-like flavoprotein